MNSTEYVRFVANVLVKYTVTLAPSVTGLGYHSEIKIFGQCGQSRCQLKNKTLNVILYVIYCIPVKSAMSVQVYIIMITVIIYKIYF